MNMTLSVLNAAALVALIAFHFQDTGVKNDQMSVQTQVHQSLSHAPQLAVMTDRSASAAMLTNDAQEFLQTPREDQRWVF
ncbi:MULTISPECIES: hypothetical protein [Pseudomonas syringae group]|uniref:Uncharacterized protein n=2 Tax=Pseudomonas syringae group TaxID=136849 RepID=A0ABX6HFI7_9PSED|nr:hypothetical protein [Pseudomonas asturiensis]QHF04344.1 hypothetical protein N015_18805 [Pseudomonas asturiensis]